MKSVKERRLVQKQAEILVRETAYYAGLMKKTWRQTRSSQKYFFKSSSRRRQKRYGPAKTPAAKLSGPVKALVESVTRNKYGESQQMKEILPLDKQISTVMSACSQALAAAHSHSSSNGEPAFVPISTTTHDDSQLVFGKKDGTKLCTAGNACQALKLKDAPGPLNGFKLEGQKAEEATFCLLCLRLHLQTLNCQLQAIDPQNKSGCLDAPFTNLQNVPGGYYAEAMGVKVGVNRIFNRQCSIVGANANLHVQYSPERGEWFVNQDIVKWNGPSF